MQIDSSEVSAMLGDEAFVRAMTRAWARHQRSRAMISVLEDVLAALVLAHLVTGVPDECPLWSECVDDEGVRSAAMAMWDAEGRPHGTALRRAIGRTEALLDFERFNAQGLWFGLT